jgi:predicted nuclease of restriction endonuclease-like RecB superfamily
MGSKLLPWRSAFKSGLENETELDLQERGISFEYEPSWGKIQYTVPAKEHTYTPDFYITTKSGKQIIVETKGLWDAQDREKHRLIKEQHPELDIRFVFSRSKAKIRKNSKTTYADICEGRGRKPFKGLTWLYADKKIPQEWLEE